MNGMWGLTPDQWLMLLFAYIFAMVAYIFFKIRGRGKLKCLILKPSKFYSVEEHKPHGNKLDFPSWPAHPEYDTSDIYVEEKSPLRFWRLPNQMLVIPEHARKALSWGKHTLGSVLTLKEHKLIVAAEVARARMKQHIISPMWAMVIVGMLGLLTVIVYVGFSRIGAF